MSRHTVITGSYPPDICGCGDYVATLVNEIRQSEPGTNLFFRKDWRLRRLRTYLREIHDLQPGVVNIQYPTEGYHKSLVPQLLCCFLRNIKVVITLHEFRRRSFLGKIATCIFFLCADWLIFTAESERDFACRVAPWIRSKSSVIQIGSNIPFQPAQTPTTDIAYFGHIRPTKGIEEFISTLSDLEIRKRLRILVIGQLVIGYENYGADILRQLTALGIEVVLNQDAESVSLMLSRTKVAFLPFPDGISRRRGSALAAMGNGCLLVTTPASTETELFHGICAMPNSASDLRDLLRDVLEDYESYSSLRKAGQAYAQSISWSSIAAAYLSVFDNCLRKSQ